MCNLKGYSTSGKMNVYIMGHLCRRNVKLFLNLELSRLNDKMYFWLMWMNDNNSQNAIASLP